MNRRNFLKTAGGTVAALGTVSLVPETQALQREAKDLPLQAVGMLYDSTLCIGCKACVFACKDANQMPIEINAPQRLWNRGEWDSPLDISGKTLNVIKIYREGEAQHKDQEKNGFAFMKRHCLHCLDPSCVSVCPVSAMRKNPQTGIVTHDPDACIGCRYCVVSCPFSVPQFQYDTPFPRIQKCQLCTHLQAEGKIPACCDVCPTGASLFGEVKDLREEAKRRLAAKSGEDYTFPHGKLGEKRPAHEAPLPTYQPYFYGAKELGGTQVIYLSGVPFEKLGLPVNVPDRSYASESEGIQHTLYKGLLAPILLLTGLSYFAYRNQHDESDASKTPPADNQQKSDHLPR